MGRKGYYNKSYTKSWTKEIRKSIQNITDAVIKNISCRPVCAPNNCGFTGAKCCIYVLIVLTLLFSGIGFYSWVIIGMLFLVLQFL